jgi:hypothetical protein
METSKKSTGQTLFDLTLYAEDTHVNHSAFQGAEKEKTMKDTYGRTFGMPFAFYDQSTQSWKTSPDMSLWDLTQSLQTLPRLGSMQNGKLFLQPRRVPRTLGSDSSFWPTPTTQEVEHPLAVLTPTGRRLSKNGKSSHSLGLADMVRMWPTPTASSWGNEGSRLLLDKRVMDGTITAEQKKQMSAGNGGKLNPMWVEWLMGFPTGWTDLEHWEML